MIPMRTIANTMMYFSRMLMSECGTAIVVPPEFVWTRRLQWRGPPSACLNTPEGMRTRSWRQAEIPCRPLDSWLCRPVLDQGPADRPDGQRNDSQTDDAGKSALLEELQSLLGKFGKRQDARFAEF
jgi:hypothetical protein